MTKDEFGSEMIDLMARAFKNGVPVEEIPAVAVENGFVLLAHLIGIEKATGRLDALKAALPQLKARQDGIPRLHEGRPNCDASVRRISTPSFQNPR